jgi:drug/metabolite transporter (DMT)-like permease
MFFLGAFLQQWGLVSATVTNAGFLTGLYVVIVPLIVLALGRGWLGIGVALAVGLAFVGTWLLGGGTLGGFSKGDWLITLGAIFWAAHVVVVGDAAALDRPVLFNALQFGGVAVLALSGAVLFEPVSLGAIAAAAPSILFVGVLSSALTFTLLSVAMRHTPPSEAAIVMSLETVFAALAGFWLLGERLTPIGWVGAGLLLAATLIVQLFPGASAGGRKAPQAAE